MRPFPLQDLLRALHEDGLPVGPRAWEAAARLLERGSFGSREDLRDALAALLGAGDDEVDRIREVFDALYPPFPIPDLEQRLQTVGVRPPEDALARAYLLDPRAFSSAGDFRAAVVELLADLVPA